MQNEARSVLKPKQFRPGLKAPFRKVPKSSKLENNLLFNFFKKKEKKKKEYKWINYTLSLLPKKTPKIVSHYKLNPIETLIFFIKNETFKV